MDIAREKQVHKISARIAICLLLSFLATTSSRTRATDNSTDCVIAQVDFSPLWWCHSDRGWFRLRDRRKTSVEVFFPLTGAPEMGMFIT